MRGAAVFQTKLSLWGGALLRLLALLAIALHVFTVEGHVHVAAFAVQGAAAHADHAAPGAGAGAPSLSNPTSQAPCVFCQAMASVGAGLTPSAPLLVWFGAAALVAMLFGQRQVSLQRLTAWRSRAPPLFA